MQGLLSEFSAPGGLRSFRQSDIETSIFVPTGGSAVSDATARELLERIVTDEDAVREAVAFLLRRELEREEADDLLARHTEVQRRA